jgi:hypothetical protein
MDAINTTLKFTKQELLRKFASIIMRLRPERASAVREKAPTARFEQLQSRRRIDSRVYGADMIANRAVRASRLR